MHSWSSEEFSMGRPQGDFPKFF